MTQLKKDLSEPRLPSWHPQRENTWPFPVDQYVDSTDHYAHVLPAGHDLFYEKDVATGYLRIIVQNQNAAVIAGTPFMPQRRAFTVADHIIERKHRNAPVPTIEVARTDLVKLGHPIAPADPSWGPIEPDWWERFARKYLGLFR